MADKNTSPIKRYALYASFFLTCFCVSLYLTFPMQALKPRAEKMILQQLEASGKRPGRHGTPAQVSIGEMDLYHLSGVSMRQLSIRTASTDPDPNPTWEIDVANVRLKLLPLVMGSLVLGFDVSAYKGNIQGAVSLVNKKPAEIDATLKGLQLGQIPAVLQTVGVPFVGSLDGAVNLTLGKSPKETKGSIKLNGEGYVLGPGEFSIPGLTGGLSIPEVRLGTLDIQGQIVDGKAKFKPAQLVGKDLQLRADVTLTLRSRFGRSMTSGGFVLKLDEAFLQANEKFKPILDFTPQLKRAKTKDGAYAYKLSGLLERLRPSPDAKFKIN